MTNLTFGPGDASFRLVATYLMALQGFVSAAEIYRGSPGAALPWPEEDTAVLDAAAGSMRLTWRPRSLVAAMVRNQWPDAICFDVEPTPPVPDGVQVELGVLENFLYGLGQSLVTNFFEEQRDHLERKHGKVAKWPPVWNFARIVRNAMSHGGKIDIRDETTVAWRRLSYSPANNGRKIINTDIWPGDLFLLVKDMEESL